MARYSNNSIVGKSLSLILFSPFILLLIGKSFALFSGFLFNWETHDQMISCIPLWIGWGFLLIFLIIYVISDWQDEYQKAETIRKYGSS
jgi:hypothetical protein